MKLSKLAATTGVTGIIIASSVVAPAFAWHPKGSIIKYVENETTGSAISDANDESSAVSAKPGDILKYTIKVSNIGAASSQGYNDMTKTVMKDSLPAGVELTNSADRNLSVDMGTIKPGKSITKTYEVKVTSQTDGDVINNKACFTGNSKANDNAQSGCDVAIVKVHVPKTPTPTPPAPQPTKPTPQQPTVLPNTGAGDVFVAGAIVSVLGYAAYLLRIKRRAAQN